MGTKRVNARLEPKHFTLLQKPRRIEFAKEMLKNVAKGPTFIKRTFHEGTEFSFESRLTLMVMENWIIVLAYLYWLRSIF